MQNFPSTQNITQLLSSPAIVTERLGHMLQALLDSPAAAKECLTMVQQCLALHRLYNIALSSNEQINNLLEEYISDANKWPDLTTPLLSSSLLTCA